MITNKFRGDIINYLMLVNRNNKLPSDWFCDLELFRCKNSIGEEFLVEKETLEHFNMLRNSLLEDGIDIELDSTYRSVEEQEELWNKFYSERGLEYTKSYIAVPGYSEHHTGLAIDIKLVKDGKIIDDNNDMINESDIFDKIHSKLASYGFILRYPCGKENITLYSYEPWHFRYVGSCDIAKKIMDECITLEEYLSNK